MSHFGLVWSNLFRRRTRTFLTLASVAVAFLLFVLLRSISAAFDDGINVTATDRLVVGAKYSQIDELPMAQKSQIMALEGVQAITHTKWFGGIYQDGRNFFATFPVDPISYFDLFSELTLEPAGALQKFAQTRTAAVVDIGLMERLGWKVGDVVPLIGGIYPQNDGSTLWEFEIVGVFSENGKGSSFPAFLFHTEYFQEAAAFGRNSVGNWYIRLDDPDRANEIAAQVDALFENSSDPTRTMTADEFNRQFARQVGDMGFITTMIMGAVFFTIVLLTANTMTQALRERIPELAVLKTLGFTNMSVSLLIMSEAMLLCLVGGGIGIGLAYLITPGLSEGLSNVFGNFGIVTRTVWQAVALCLGIGLAIGAIPAINAHRLTIVDALRR